jgi:hypothetical protein
MDHLFACDPGALALAPREWGKAVPDERNASSRLVIDAFRRCCDGADSYTAVTAKRLHW